jgi:hypothetical protein
MTHKIPKRIIQTNKSLDGLSLLEKAAVANITLLNPDCEYLFFDDRQVENFIDDEFPHYRKILDSFVFPIQKYDFFRYLAVYRLGGIYLDMDIFLASSLSELFDYECVFPFEGLTINTCLRDEHNMDWDIGNYAFGAASGHPFLAAIIENCVRAQTEPAWLRGMQKSIPRILRSELGVLYTTGPWLISRTLAEFPNARERVEVLFPDDVCNPKDWNRFGKFGVHLMGGSWRPRGALKRRLRNYWERLMTRKQIERSKKLGKTRSLEFKLAESAPLEYQRK